MVLITADEHIIAETALVQFVAGVILWQNIFQPLVFFFNRVHRVINDDTYFLFMRGMTMDEILKAIRKELNISQEVLARDLNVSFTTLNRWENNKAKPSRLAMIQLREYCTDKDLPGEIITALEHARY
jgi:DNA-binding XRE family transcriptional regulator